MQGFASEHLIMVRVFALFTVEILQPTETAPEHSKCFLFLVKMLEICSLGPDEAPTLEHLL